MIVTVYLLYKSGFLNEALIKIINWEKRLKEKGKLFSESDVNKVIEGFPGENYAKVNEDGDNLPFDIYTPTDRPKIVAPLGIGWLFHYREPLFNFVMEKRKKFIKSESENSFSSDFNLETDPYDYHKLIMDIIKETEKLKNS